MIIYKTAFKKPLPFSIVEKNINFLGFQRAILRVPHHKKINFAGLNSSSKFFAIFSRSNSSCYVFPFNFLLSFSTTVHHCLVSQSHEVLPNTKIT